MSFKQILAGAISLSLTACATSPVPPQKTQVPPSLLQVCPTFQELKLSSNADLLRGYVEALAWGADCRARHRSLAEAVK